GCAPPVVPGKFVMLLPEQIVAGFLGSRLPLIGPVHQLRQGLLSDFGLVFKALLPEFGKDDLIGHPLRPAILIELVAGTLLRAVWLLARGRRSRLNVLLMRLVVDFVRHVPTTEDLGILVLRERLIARIRLWTLRTGIGLVLNRRSSGSSR